MNNAKTDTNMHPRPKPKALKRKITLSNDTNADGKNHQSKKHKSEHEQTKRVGSRGDKRK